MKHKRKLHALKSLSNILKQLHVIALKQYDKKIDLDLEVVVYSVYPIHTKFILIKCSHSW